MGIDFTDSIDFTFLRFWRHLKFLCALTRFKKENEGQETVIVVWLNYSYDETSYG